MTKAAVPSRIAAKAGGILTLCRVSNLPTVWMNVLAAVVLTGGASVGVVILLCGAISALYCGGIALNDLFDRERDAREQPYRPIPSGRVTPGEALSTVVLLFALGLGLLLLAPFPAALVPGLVLLGLILAYDRFHKQHASTVLLMAGCRLMVFAVTAWAVAGSVGVNAFVGGAVCFLYTLAISLVARRENTRGEPYSFSVIPWMIAGMSAVDGAVVAVLVTPLWLLPGVGAALLTLLGQRWVRGD